MTHTPTKTDTGPAGILAALNAVVSETGYTAAQLCGRSRFPDLLAARHKVWWLCLKAGYSSNQIGDALGFEGSSIRSFYRRLRKEHGEWDMLNGSERWRSPISTVSTGGVLGTFRGDVCKGSGDD